jgi:hypothetical protein
MPEKNINFNLPGIRDVPTYDYGEYHLHNPGDFYGPYYDINDTTQKGLPKHIHVYDDAIEQILGPKSKDEGYVGKETNNEWFTETFNRIYNKAFQSLINKESIIKEFKDDIGEYKGEVYYIYDTNGNKKIIKNNGKFLRHGLGTNRFADGHIYSGPWYNNFMNGYGILTHEDDSIFCKTECRCGYYGDFKNGKMHGQGVAFNDNKGKCYKYEGKFNNNEPFGKGTFTDYSDPENPKITTEAIIRPTVPIAKEENYLYRIFDNDNTIMTKLIKSTIFVDNAKPFVAESYIPPSGKKITRKNSKVYNTVSSHGSYEYSSRKEKTKKGGKRKTYRKKNARKHK